MLIDANDNEDVAEEEATRENSASMEMKIEQQRRQDDEHHRLQMSKKGAKLSTRDVLAQSFIFLFAGFETTASTIHFSIYLMALHDDEQQRCYNDIVEHCGLEVGYISLLTTMDTIC